jgi:putative ABC transport system substrate-binding protein
MQFHQLKRREFITLLSGATVAWPLAARAQQSGRVRRIGVLMHLAADDPEGQARHAAFLQGLQQVGWSAGRNVRIDTRWAASEADRRQFAGELVALAPDVILTSNSTTTAALQAATQIVPIVFSNVTDPVAAGFVESFARPGGNATGFSLFEYGISAKWLELLKEIAPGTMRAAVFRESTNPAGIGQFGAIQSVAPSHGVEVSSIVVRDGSEIERAIAPLARSGNGGLIVTASGLRASHNNLIVTLAARYQLPAIYPFSFFVTDGGLISYGPDSTDGYRRAAQYVDRILKGEKPADLPVQAPTKYELVINLKTAKALGLEMPPAVLARADEVVE